MSHYITPLVEQLIATSVWEWLAFVFGVSQVILAARNKTVNFYAGIISVTIYIFIFWKAGLFAESLLNVYYLIISVWGIYAWQNRLKNNLIITKTTTQEWLIVFGIIAIASLGIWLVLKTYTSSTVPFADAIVSAIAWAGTWLLLRRKVENWIVLNVSNAIAMPIQYSKGLELTSVLTLIFFLVAIKGYIDWKNKFNNELVNNRKFKP